MYKCPHCKSASVTFLSKWLSSRVFPVKCEACGGLSYAPGSAGGVVMVVGTLTLTLAGFAAVYWQSLWPFAACVSLVFPLWFLRLHAQPLLELTSKQVAESRKAEGFGLVLLVLFSAMQ